VLQRINACASGVGVGGGVSSWRAKLSRNARAEKFCFCHWLLVVCLLPGAKDTAGIRSSENKVEQAKRIAVPQMLERYKLFASFTGTKVQILTPEELSDSVGLRHASAQTAFTA
jgi:hypothetical protein